MKYYLPIFIERSGAENYSRTMDMMHRYSALESLPEIGPKGRENLARARVLCIEAGALGCPVLLYLASAGVGTLGVADAGVVDMARLGAEILYSERDAGQARVSAAKNRLLMLNTEIAVNTHREGVTAENIAGLFSGYDVIVDGANDPVLSALINGGAIKTGKPVVHGAAAGWAGHVAVFDPGQGGPCLQCAHLTPLPAQGISGPLAGIIGAAMVVETVKLAAGFKQGLRDRIWRIDARTMETDMTEIQKDKNCPACSQTAAEPLPQYSSPVCAAQVQEITCAEAASMNDAVMFDVRERDEWDAGHIEGATLLPLSMLRQNPDLFAPPPGKSCILYCQRGKRSMIAGEILRQAGFMNLYSMAGGYEAWCSR
jgi:adenylyltransferase/sulfurtransferase